MDHPQQVVNVEILRERERQDKLWGEQNHDAGTWALILLEEIGEWAKAELPTRFGGPEAGRQRHEAVHAAAVAHAIVECMERKKQAEERDGARVNGVMDAGLWGLQKEEKGQ